eukprot:scaffold1806_cov240-Pinguiococcus_pyrenoidosus.AAC.26
MNQIAEEECEKTLRAKTYTHKILLQERIRNGRSFLWLSSLIGWEFMFPTSEFLQLPINATPLDAEWNSEYADRTVEVGNRQSPGFQTPKQKGGPANASE